MSQVEAHAWVASIKREIDKQFYVQRKKSLDKV
jgi:hypothetical protein